MDLFRIGTSNNHMSTTKCNEAPNVFILAHLIVRTMYMEELFPLNKMLVVKKWYRKLPTLQTFKWT